MYENFSSFRVIQKILRINSKNSAFFLHYKIRLENLENQWVISDALDYSSC